MLYLSKCNKTNFITAEVHVPVAVFFVTSHNVNVGICFSERYDALQKSSRRLYGWRHRGSVPVTRAMCHEVSFNGGVHRIRFCPELVSVVLAEETNMRQNREPSRCHHVRPDVTQPNCDKTGLLYDSDCVCVRDCAHACVFVYVTGR